ncbi:hypothetical protein B0T14DRAFT_401857, partial [Immersiella caudata]
VPMPVPEPEQSNRKQRPEPNKLQRRQRTYSFSPGRRDSIGPHRRRSVRAQRQPHGPAPNTTTGDTPMGMMRDDDLRRVPTLHNKRDGDDLPRKKSSKKRRRNDHQREAEIKAMSNFVPLRRATEDWTGGHPAGMDGRRVRTSFGLGFKGSSRQEWDKYNRSSDISLPAESIHSAHSSDSEYLSFKVSALEALAPRPTLRYATHPRPGAEGGDFGMRLARASSRQQKKLSAPIPEATLKAHKRIHDLADELSASDLRELMERDQRRRDRKRQMDQERLEQRLARRAEKQRAAEAEAKRQGRDSPANLERGVLGREVLGLGTDPTSAVITSSRIRQSDESLKEKGKDAEIDPAAAPGDESRPHPLAAFHRTNSIPLQSPKLESLPAEPKKQPAQPLTSPRSRTSFIRLKLSRSSTPQGSDIKTEHSDPPQKGHETANSKAPLSWATFFRWGNKHKHRSAGPSSFSNTSRDSMQAAPQAPTPPANFIPRRLSAGVPKRTMSRFREDLPELPLSPPDSRIQSPEATAIPGATEPSALTNAVMEHVILAPPRQADRYDTPTSEQRSMEAMRQTPSTFGHPDEPSVSPELQTMSLASIDSEGSWLSGKMSKKRKPSGSLRATPYGQRPRTTSESDAEHIPDQDNNTNEEMSIAEDDYLARYTSSPVERPGWNRKSTGDPRPSSDGEEETHWGSVRGHQPQLVHSHTAGRVKSREVLLKSFGEEGEIDAVVSGSKNVDNDDDEDDEGETSGLQRATSINLGKEHVRHISAGSARLLSISPRSSVDTK